MEAFITANIAIAEAAINVRLDVFAGYPITPVSDIMEYLALKLPQYGGRVIQVEDEIAAINLIIGASWAGAKAMTATSGPGFSLMAEGLGLAVMTETPIVIAYIMRAGPSTGIATMYGQADIMQTKWSSHGQYEIITLAPWSAQEAYDLTIKAFKLAEEYRVPVIVLGDAALAHIREKVRLRDEPTIIERKKPELDANEIKPFKADESLIPPMPCFGEGYRVFVESLCHDESGFYTTDPEVYEKLVKRLNDKIRVHSNKIFEAKTYSMQDAKQAILAYGSLARICYTIVRRLRAKGYKIGFIRPTTLWPISREKLLKLIGDVKSLIVVEGNYGQLVREIERLTDNTKVKFVYWLKPYLPTPQELYTHMMNLGINFEG